MNSKNDIDVANIFHLYKSFWMSWRHLNFMLPSEMLDVHDVNIY